MSIWNRIKTTISNLGVNVPLVSLFRGPPEHSVAFTIAIIALAAKMAKADGRVTRDEVSTLRQIFEFDPRDEDDIARVFDLARQDVAGFQDYAKRIRRMFQGDPEMVDEIFESLFQIAIADGELHENEDAFLEEVREIFDVRKHLYTQLKAQYLQTEDASPFAILGVEYDASPEEIKAAYRKTVRENHPDQLRARGLPAEAVALAENRIRAANQAYEQLRAKQSVV